MTQANAGCFAVKASELRKQDGIHVFRDDTISTGKQLPMYLQDNDELPRVNSVPLTQSSIKYVTQSLPRLRTLVVCG